jgi:hypothetical protein
VYSVLSTQSAGWTVLLRSGHRWLFPKTNCVTPNRVSDHMQQHKTLPAACWSGLELRNDELPSPSRIAIGCSWRQFRAKENAVLVNGSYGFANHSGTRPR